MIQGAIQQLKNVTHPPPPPRIAALFVRAASDPTPLLGIVPILENNVTIEVPQFAADAKAPMYVNAQGNGKGSIEATSISSFLVTMNTLAAGAIEGSLEKGISPFTVHYNMKQQYYINASDIHMGKRDNGLVFRITGGIYASSPVQWCRSAPGSPARVCISDDRMLVLSDTHATITDLQKRRIIEIDFATETYSVTPISEMVDATRKRENLMLGQGGMEISAKTEISPRWTGNTQI